MHYIHRTWLFVGTLLGALGWWVIAMLSGEAEEFRSFYLVLVAYVLLAVKDFNWQLNKPWDSQNEAFTALIGSYRLVIDNWPVQLGILVIGIASAFDLYTDVFSTTTNIAICVLIAIVFITSRVKSRNAAMPWAYLVMLLGVWWLAHVGFRSEGIVVSQVHGIQAYTIQKWVAWMGVLFCGLALWNGRQQLNNHGWWSIACLAPVLWLVVAHQITGDVYPDYYWASWLGFLGLLLHYLAARHLAANPGSPLATWPILASHFGFAVAMAIFFRDASLTLALATQLITLAMISRQYQISFLSWMIKIVLAVIVTRLTLNPWLFTYPPDVHWSLWSYGGATVCCAIATWLLRADERMRKWLEIGSLHLLVLTLAAETRYWLYDGAIFTHHYGLMEASINFPLWAGLSLVYRWRSVASSHLAAVYKLLSRILLNMAVVNYLALLLLLDSNRGIDQIASTPIWNLLLLTFGVPVILFALIYRFHETKFKRIAGIATGVSLFIFLSVEIRHLWQGQLISFNSISSGEQYTYSVVWLLMAIAAIILGHWKNRTQLYKGGTILLALVIAKLFLVDLSDLVGLWRVASFMGLGLSLLGLAYLHRFVGDRELDSTAG